MSDIPAPVFLGAGAIVLLAFIWLVWVGTRPLPAAARWLARGLAVVAVLAPLALWQIESGGLVGSAPQETASRPKAEKPAMKKLEESAGERDARVRADAEREQAELRKREGERAAARREPPPSPPGATEEAAREPDILTRGTGPDGVAATDAGAWDVVPVFYGTDRNRESETVKRIVYGADRDKRLELGRALVTIPKVHQVPEIERPWVYTLPFTRVVIYEEPEDPEKHFTLRQVQAMTESQWLAIVRERLRTSERFKDHAVVFVHGFNTSFDFALYRTAQITYDLKFDGAPFVYSWPSQGKVLSYSYDRESVQQAQPYLKQFLDLVVQSTGATKVSVIAHSMGNQLLLPVLRDLKRSLPDGVKLSQVILAAPDVDRDGFEFLANEIQGVSNGITLYAHGNDRALEISKQFWGGVPRAGDVPSDGPVIIAGLDTIDVTATSTDIFNLHHSGYAESKALLNDIELLLQTGERPPEKRIPILERITTSKGDYWKYPARP